MSAGHENACENKHRNRQKRKAVDTAHHGTDDIAGTGCKRRIKDPGKDRDDSQCNGYRDRDQKAKRKQNKNNNR